MDEYTVYVNIPEDVSLREVINAGLLALGYEVDDELETNFVDNCPS